MPGFLYEQTGADGRCCAVNTDTRRNVTWKKINNVTLKKRHRARWDIPVMHTARQIYDGVC